MMRDQNRGELRGRTTEEPRQIVGKQHKHGGVGWITQKQWISDKLAAGCTWKTMKVKARWNTIWLYFSLCHGTSRISFRISQNCRYNLYIYICFPACCSCTCWLSSITSALMFSFFIRRSIVFIKNRTSRKHSGVAAVLGAFVLTWRRL